MSKLMFSMDLKEPREIQAMTEDEFSRYFQKVVLERWILEGGLDSLKSTRSDLNERISRCRKRRDLLIRHIGEMTICRSSVKQETRKES